MCTGKSQTDEKKEKASETDSMPKFSFVLSRKRTRAELGLDDSGMYFVERTRERYRHVVVRGRGRAECAT